MKPNLLFINSISILGGGEIWTINTIKEFAGRGYNVSLVCRKNSGILIPAKQINAEIFELNISGDLNPFTISQLVRIFKKQKVDIVIANTGKDLRIAGLASKFLKDVKVIARQGIDYPLKNNLVYRYTYNSLASGLIANSESTKKTMLKNAPWLKPDKIKVIYNGINPELYGESNADNLRKEFGLSESDFVLGFVGRLSVQKGVVFALESFKSLARIYNNIHLLICGEGELKNEIENFILINNLENRIHLSGFRNDIPNVMRTIDVLLTPSLWEGFGIVLIEAMASGKPCVASNTSSIPEIIQDRVNGLLFSLGNSEEIVEAITKLVNDPELAHQLGNNGLKIFREKFTIDRMINEYEKVFKDISA